MKYIVRGEMEWFDDISEIEAEQIDDDIVFKTDNPNELNCDTEYIEMIGNIIYCQTGNFTFTAEIVYLLAKEFGILDMLNFKIPEIKELFDREFNGLV